MAEKAGWTAVGALFGAVAAVVTGYFGFANKDRELDIEMVRVSLSILSGENVESSHPGRRFALRALQQYSGVDIPADDFETWVASGTVPRIAPSPDLCAGLAGKYVDALSSSPLTVAQPVQGMMRDLGCLPPIIPRPGNSPGY